MEHYDGVESTLWLKDEHGYRASADELTSGRMSVHIWCETPEQAIAATLGRGECTYEIAAYGDGKTWFACSKCGGMTSADYDPPKYCPHCGAKVVDE